MFLKQLGHKIQMTRVDNDSFVVSSNFGICLTIRKDATSMRTIDRETKNQIRSNNRIKPIFCIMFLGIHRRSHTTRGGRSWERCGDVERTSQYQISPADPVVLGHHSRSVLRSLALGHFSRGLQRYRYVYTSCPFLLAIPTSVAVERGESTEVVGSMRRHRIAPKTLFNLLRYAVHRVAVPLSFSVSRAQSYLTFASRYISVPAYLSSSCFELNNSDFRLFFLRAWKHLTFNASKWK